ncbi:MAG: glycosyltransferase family 39 protein [Fibrobacterota bacterium]
MADNKKSGRDEWVLLKRSLVSQGRAFLDLFRELHEESDIAREILLFLPFAVALAFFYYTNRIAYFYHHLGNYGFEEQFLGQVVPLVNDLLSGRFSRLSLGLEGPLYPLLLALKARGGHDILKSALFLNALFGTGALLWAYYLLRTVFGTRTAALSLLFIATNAVYFEFTYTACPGVVFLLFCVGALHLFFKGARDGRAALLFLSGALMALAVLTNIAALLLLLFAGLAVLTLGLVGEGARARARTLAWVCAGFAVFFLPALLFLKGHSVHLFTALPFVKAAGGNALLTHLKTGYFRIFMNIGELIGWALGVFVVLGILFAVLTPQDRPRRAFHLLGLLFFLGLSLLEFDKLNSFILVIFLVPLAADVVGSGLYRRTLERRFALALLLAFTGLSFFSVFSNMDRIGGIAKGEPKQLLALAEYLSDHPGAKGLVLAQRPLLARRLDMPFLQLDSTTNGLLPLLRQAKEKGARLLLADFPEYNAFPFLRFLADPAMTRPFGLREVAREYPSALYEFDFTALTALEGVAGPDTAALRALSLPRPAALPPFGEFLKHRLVYSSRRDALDRPPFQVVTQYRLQGILLSGVLFRGAFKEVVTANLYQPGATASGVKTSRGVVILPGNDRDGKASLLAKNYAENLAASGMAVLCIDAPGTGERTGPVFSHDAYLVNAGAVGFAPADAFVSEALAARRVLCELTGASSDSVGLIGIGEDAFTALYAAALEPGFTSVAIIGGLSPMAELAASPRAPVQALITGVAAYGTEALLLAVGANRVRYYPLEPGRKEWAFFLGNNLGFTVVPSESPDQFVKEGFEKSLQKMGEDLGNDAIRLAAARFTGLPEQQKQATFTVGAQDLNEISAPFMEIPLQVNLEPAFTPVDTPSSDAPFPLPWQLWAAPAGPVKRVLVWLQSADAALDSGLAQKAVDRGYAVCRLPLFDRCRNYAEARQRYYNLLLAGIRSDLQWKAALRAIADRYRVIPDLFAADSLASLVAVRLAADSLLSAGSLILSELRTAKVSAFTGGLLDGYDGVAYAEGAYVNLPRVRASLVMRAYRDLAARDWMEAASKARRVRPYCPPADTFAYDDALPKGAARITTADSLFR